MNGFLNLYKPEGISSAKVLNAVKHAVRGVSVGHMGTLDPLASGVLPVAIGKSTRLFGYLLDKEKEYIATVAFGYETDTLDLEGKIVKSSVVIPEQEEVERAARTLTGEIMQTPPIFSAKCVDGKRSYALARKGKEFSLPPKKVTIKSIEVLDRQSDNEYKIKIVCRGGTYIRAIARDLGVALNSCATMTSLKRTASGVFRIENSVSAEDFVNASDKSALLLSPDCVVDFPCLYLSERETVRLFNGLYDIFEKPDGIYRVYAPDGFYGVGEMTDGKLKVKAYLRDV